MTQLRAGVIGLGMGQGHVKSFLNHPEATVVAIADINNERLQEIGDQYHIPGRYLKAEEMLAKEKLDLVGIATPNKFHHPLTLAALEAGAHVLCEKPMAMDSRQAEEMIAAADKAKRKLMINFSHRFHKTIWNMKKLCENGELGQIYFARTVWHRRRGLPGFGGWFSNKELSGGGPLIDLGVHRMDMALWLMGYPEPEWVLSGNYNHIAKNIAQAEGKNYDVEDMASGMIRFKNGATMLVEASWAANIAQGELMETRILGSKAGLLQKNINGGYNFETFMFKEVNGVQCDIRLADEFLKETSTYTHFIDSIVADTPHLACGREGLIVQRILDALYQSAAQGEPVKI